MTELPSNPLLLYSLGRLVRGLSALFWGLPLTLVVCVHTLQTDVFRSFGVLPPMAVTGWVLYGLWELGHFQKQERIWIATLERTRLLALVNCGLSPFLYWRNQLPDEPFFNQVLLLALISGVLFLSSLNVTLGRLTAMLPDETLRGQTRSFTRWNRGWLLSGLVLTLGWLGLTRWLDPSPTVPAGWWMAATRESLWPMIGLALLPLAVTMALIWKIKDVILGSVFGGRN